MRYGLAPGWGPHVTIWRGLKWGEQSEIAVSFKPSFGMGCTHQMLSLTMRAELTIQQIVGTLSSVPILHYSPDA